MSFSDLILISANDFLAAFGEPVTVKVSGGDDRVISAIIDYDSEAALSGNAAPGKGAGISILVKNSRTDGISSNEFERGKYSVMIPFRVSDIAEERPITKILEQDAGMVRYQVR